MHIIILISLVILFLILLVTVFNFFTAPMLRTSLPLTATPKVSLLIPVRNEERTIEACLKGLLAQDYPNYEIFVYNDQSDDDTAAIIKKIATTNQKVKFINGGNLPAAWTGKNWACFQLSKQATGDIFIFTDGDNWHAPSAIKNTVAYMQKYNIGLLSAFPQQITVTLYEKLVVPIMDIFVYGTLPLWATYYAPQSSLAAANGQWNAFTREAYTTMGGHQVVRTKIVEDTELSRLAKKKNIKILTTAGTDIVFCRMYHNANEVWQGFTRSYYGLTGYNDFAFWGIMTSLLFAFILPYLFLFITPLNTFVMTAIGVNIFIRLLISVKFKHPLITSIVLHPIGIFYAMIIGINSLISAKRGFVQWKNRRIHIRINSAQK